MEGTHHVTVPNHRPLKTGTLLGGILKPVAAHHKITVEDLLATVQCLLPGGSIRTYFAGSPFTPFASCISIKSSIREYTFSRNSCDFVPLFGF